MMAAEDHYYSVAVNARPKKKKTQRVRPCLSGQITADMNWKSQLLYNGDEPPDATLGSCVSRRNTSVSHQLPTIVTRSRLEVRQNALQHISLYSTLSIGAACLGAASS